MLSRSENKVMRALTKMRKDKNSLLVSPMDLLSVLGDKEFNHAFLEKIIQDLCSDGYFDLVYSDRRGEKVYCITFLQKGQAYNRNTLIMRRNLVFRLGVTVVLAIVSFLIGLVLKAIF
jgi:hypothetical protein